MPLETRDRARLEALLRRDVLWGGYGLADLDEAHFPRTRWFLSDEDGRALMLLYRFAGRASVITYGDGPAAAEIVRAVDLDGPCDLHVPVNQMSSVGALFAGRFEPYVRMGVERPDVRPIPLPKDIAIRELGPADLPQVRATQRHYPDTAFQEDHLGEELYLAALRRRDGRMLAMAGTHVSSAAYGVAAIGSVVTEPAWRGRGLGTAITSALCCRLFADGRIRLIVLNVGANNPAAQRVYEKLGFSRPIPYFEGIGVRKRTR
ncbi:MAG: GNAT family N-acetyltransferase [Planctomycetota bacterium]|nr:GNAT family N-acetyltransferase [Planctomycetota bacterium]